MTGALAQPDHASDGAHQVEILCIVAVGGSRYRQQPAHCPHQCLYTMIDAGVAAFIRLLV